MECSAEPASAYPGKMARLVGGEEGWPPNGAQTEDVIYAAMTRLEFYESGKFACPQNAMALEYLQKAMDVLNDRTVDRKVREVEGLHQE